MMVLVAHGTRSTAGVETVEALGAAVAAQIGPVRTAFVDVVGPDPAEVLREISGPAVVVPAFLASGYHVRTDLPARIAQSGHPNVTVTRTLGPDRALADAMHDRLREVGWHNGDAVVMAAAGSSDLHAQRELRWAAALLAERVGRVQVGFVAMGMPRVADVVARLRAGGRRRVFIASYLLAPGMFHERLRECGATAVAAPLGVHPVVVDLITCRSERVAGVA